ncbi:MAG TPA: DinB family protein [Jatrophihabitans sp.]|jgi:uncharacterized damage-inducible protein DinB|uniref:DinB family protein n=1 Tax=Jatrophihabitans sp. TaxID=1932789 RepID=UPI002E0CC5FA|nr:DinB family protein [Jatrophihabitans sp.]
MTDERAMLLDHLRSGRRHVLGALDGLDDAALHRPVLPSGWSALGLVQHLTVDVERFWFGAVLTGEPAAIAQLDSRTDTGVWHVPADAAAAPILAAYREAAERSDAAVAATDLDAEPAWWPRELFGDWRLENARDLLLHVIVETSTHAGHLDAARELIDGKTWLVLTEFD